MPLIVFYRALIVFYLALIVFRLRRFGGADCFCKLLFCARGDLGLGASATGAPAGSNCRLGTLGHGINTLNVLWDESTWTSGQCIEDTRKPNAPRRRLAENENFKKIFDVFSVFLTLIVCPMRALLT